MLGDWSIHSTCEKWRSIVSDADPASAVRLDKPLSVSFHTSTCCNNKDNHADLPDRAVVMRHNNICKVL